MSANHPYQPGQTALLMARGLGIYFIAVSRPSIIHQTNNPPSKRIQRRLFHDVGVVETHAIWQTLLHCAFAASFVDVCDNDFGALFCEEL